MRKMIDMAREAGMTGLEAGGLFDNFLVFEALVRADEREACAKVCDEVEDQCEKLLVPDEKWPTPADCAHIIRARGNT
jgi:hypothetical protein